MVRMTHPFVRSGNSQFTKIPQELHREIINNLEYISVLSLSVTCRYLFLLCQDQFVTLFNESVRFGQWTGDRIAIIGKYTRTVPEHLLPANFTSTNGGYSLT